MTELIFIVTEEPSGGYNARALGHAIFTQADSREELVANARDAVHCHFDLPEQMAKVIHFYYVHDEVVAV